MNIECIVIGNLKEKYWQDASKEYQKRMGRYCKLTIKELKEVKLPEKASDANIEQALKKESQLIMKNVSDTDYVIVLAIGGMQYTSEDFAAEFEKMKMLGKKIIFIIGSSHGLSDTIYKRANRLISFSPMTFPHQFARVILLEQMYRSFKINANESYHK